MTKPAKRRMAYAGALHHDGSLVHAYFGLTRDGELEDKAQLYGQPLGDFPPGSVCEFSVLPDGAVKDLGKFIEVWHDTAAVHEWTARHNATAASEAAWGAKELPKAFGCLEPIRAAYKRLDPERQGVLVAQIVRYLESPDA